MTVWVAASVVSAAMTGRASSNAHSSCSFAGDDGLGLPLPGIREGGLPVISTLSSEKQNVIYFIN